MAYNHQRGMAKAVGTLYRNRGPQQQQPDMDFGKFGTSLGGMISSARRNSGPRPSPSVMSNAIRSAQMQDAIQRQSMRRDTDQLVMSNAIRSAQMQDAIQRQTMRRDMQGLDSGFIMAPEKPVQANGQLSQQDWEDKLIRESQQDALDLDFNEFKEAAQRMKNTERANLAPVAGRFSESGYRDHVKQSQAQAADAEVSKRLMYGGMGMGGTRPRGPGEL